MKLRNKKTGEIVEGERYAVTVWRTYGDNPSYNSLAELNEEWEDYKPNEPLIEDLKARKVFREWAEILDAEQFRVVHFAYKKPTTLFRSTDLTTESSIELPGHIGKESEIYTRSELIGEEE